MCKLPSLSKLISCLLLCNRYVKEKRVAISPNFNFLGQLLEYEQLMDREDSSNFTGSKRRCIGKPIIVVLILVGIGATKVSTTCDSLLSES